MTIAAEPAAAAPLLSRGSIALYGGALVQGLGLVAFPASATVLRDAHGLGDGAYGSLFLPQTVCTIAAALAGGALARRVGLVALLVTAGSAVAASMSLLAATSAVPHAAVLPVLWCATALLGIGFGLSAAPLNAMPALLHPARADSALVASHTLVGVGLAGGPLAIGPLVSSGRWLAYPIAVAAVAALLAVVALQLPRADRAIAPAATAAPRARLDRRTLVAFGAIAVFYALCEGVFSSWSAIFLHEARGIGEATATFATGAFWMGVVGGRLAVTALVGRVPRRTIWLALPIAMAAVLLALPCARGAVSGIALFAAAGLASSSFFPLTIAEATAAAPADAARISSLLVAALMLGSGGGAFVLGAVRQAAPFDTIYRAAAVLPIVALVVACRLSAGAAGEARGALLR